MKLLDEIIDLLSDEKGSLTAALLKTKVLMHRLGHGELAEWVNNELSGYAAGTAVPEYRTAYGRVVGNIQNTAMIQAGVTLPTSHLTEKMQKFLHNHEIREPIKVLEEWTADGTRRLEMPLQPEYFAEFDKALNGYWVQKAALEITPGQIQRGLVQVRSRLLDFALGLQGKVAHIKDDEVQEVMQKEDVPRMFHSIMAGDNATIVFGSNNVVSVRNSVKKGDFDSLANTLRSKGVAEEDVSALREAIASDQDAPELAVDELGPGVKAWMKRMWGKAVDASWNIELGIAGGLLTEALRAYYFS
jgi:hypothetical protein